VHWGGDTLGHEKVWFLGPHFIGPFREHHIDQKAITRHDFVETNGNTCFFACVPVVAALLLLPEREGPGLFAGAFVAFVALFVMATNQFHKWAHMDTPPAIARVLQHSGLILRPAHHEIHHARPHDKHYCITVGWMNPVLNKVRFFRGVEWVIAQIRPSWLHIEHRALYTASRLAASASASLTGDNPHAPNVPTP
jgi:ubiquitin-conjugating enzyme E2 variant